MMIPQIMPAMTKITAAWKLRVDAFMVFPCWKLAVVARMERQRNAGSAAPHFASHFASLHAGYILAGQDFRNPACLPSERRPRYCSNIVTGFRHRPFPQTVARAPARR